MQKAYKVMGVSTIKPEGLPKAFTVVEREIGEVFQCDPLRGTGKVNFVETKQGDVVIYREGVQGSNLQVRHSDLLALASFLGHVFVEHSEGWVP